VSYLAFIIHNKAQSICKRQFASRSKQITTSYKDLEVQHIMRQDPSQNMKTLVNILYLSRQEYMTE